MGCVAGAGNGSLAADVRADEILETSAGEIAPRRFPRDAGARDFGGAGGRWDPLGSTRDRAKDAVSAFVKADPLALAGDIANSVKHLVRRDRKGARTPELEARASSGSGGRPLTS
jgi:hypothetical protein